MKNVYFDIETTGLDVFDGDILTSIQYRIDGKKLVVVNAAEVPAGLVRDDVEILYKSEKDMILHFADTIKGNIGLGWNVSHGKLINEKYQLGFDIHFIVKRGEMIGVDVKKMLGGRQSKKSNGRYEQDIYYFKKFVCIDLAVAYNRYINSKQSLALEAVADAEGIINKMEHGEVNWRSWHKEDPDAWLDYGVRDVDVMVELNEKRNIIKTMIEVSDEMNCKLEHTCMPSVYWASRMDVEMEGINKKEFVEDTFDGGLSGGKTIINKHYVDGAMIFDVKSMYPSLIMAFNMSPDTMTVPANIKITGANKDGPAKIESLETIIDDIRNNRNKPSAIPGVNNTPTGAVFMNGKRGILPMVLVALFDKRAEAKKRIKDMTLTAEDRINANNRQLAIKTIMNALYGVQGLENYRYYTPSIYATTSVSGQVIMGIVVRDLEDAGYVIPYSDTDSVFVEGAIIYLDEVRAIIDKSIDKFKAYYGIEGELEMEYENYYKKCKMFAKKKYCVIDENDEYQETGMLSKQKATGRLWKDWVKEGNAKLYHFGNPYMANANLIKLIDKNPKISYISGKCKSVEKKFLEDAKRDKEMMEQEYGCVFNMQDCRDYFRIIIGPDTEVLVPNDFINHDEKLAELITREDLYTTALYQAKSFMNPAHRDANINKNNSK